MSALGWLEDLRSGASLPATLSEQGPRVAAGLLALLIAVQAGFLVTARNNGAPAAVGPALPVTAMAPRNAKQGAVQIDRIVNAHLFGEARATSDAGNAPQTSVSLTLAGVLALPDPKKGLAIIAPTAGSARLYTVGAAVPGGVRLYAVYPDRVLLDRGGVIESLLLPRKLSSAGAAAPLARGVQASPAQRLAALAQDNGALLGGLLRTQAVFQAGKLSGYRVFPGGGAARGFAQLGLRPGDLVTAINGTSLDDPSRGNEIMQTLSSAATATVTVNRNGQVQDLNLNLEAVASQAESAVTQGATAGRRGGAFGGPGAFFQRGAGPQVGVATPAVTTDTSDAPAPPGDAAVEQPASEQ